MQVDQPNIPEPILVIPADQWETLPIQPSAGYWWRIARRLAWGLLIAFSTLAGLAIASVSDRYFASLTPPVNALVVVLAISMIVVCVIAARPYKKERNLGYTTWPSSKELGNRL